MKLATLAVAILTTSLILLCGCASATDATVPAGTALAITVTPTAPSAQQTFDVMAHAHNDELKMQPWASWTVDGEGPFLTPTEGEVSGHDVSYHLPLTVAEGAHSVTVEVETTSSVKTEKSMTVTVAHKVIQEPLAATR